MNLPVVYTQYSPLAIIRLLDFCTRDMAQEAISEVLNQFGVDGEKKFESKLEYRSLSNFIWSIFTTKGSMALQRSALRNTIKAYLIRISPSIWIFGQYSECLC
jgi:hypothetical protein